MKTFSQFALTEATYGSLDTAKSIIKTLQTAGFQGYLVGGCVRDKLLGKQPKDFDVATDAHPDQLTKMFPTVKLAGAHFAVVIVDGVEIATFRSDGDYGDGRRPDKVEYEKSFREDAARRDFTCNAMAMDPFTGHILDYYGGEKDIKDKILRAVGDPYKRFAEDHLRMLRAVRFAAKLGFTIDPDTLAAMKGLAPKIKKMSSERITQELTGALNFPGGPFKSFNTLKSTGLLEHILPELDSLSSSKHSILVGVLEQIHHESHLFGLAAFFCQLDLKTVGVIAKRLKLTNDDTEHILGILQLQPQIAEVTQSTSLDVLKKLMRNKDFGEALKLFGMRVKARDPLVHSSAFDLLTHMFAGMSQEDLHPQLFVSGADLISLGLKPGPNFKRILDKLEIGQLTGHITSKEQALKLVSTI